jgi:hypothetical protein
MTHVQPNQIKVTVNRQSRMIERKIEGQNRRNFFSIKYQKKRQQYQDAKFLQHLPDSRS